MFGFQRTSGNGYKDFYVLVMRQLIQKFNSEGKKIKILLTAERTLVREAWSLIFKNDSRFQVIAECGTPEAALLKARDLRPDIIIMEIKPPELSGIEMASLVPKFSPGSRILVVSLYTAPHTVREVMKAGVSGYVTKTSPQEEMLQAVMTINEGQTYLCREFRKSCSEQSKDPGLPEEMLGQLSIREFEVFVGLRGGLDFWKIASQLNIGELTVEMHRREVLKKLNLNESELDDFLNKN